MKKKIAKVGRKVAARQQAAGRSPTASQVEQKAKAIIAKRKGKDVVDTAFRNLSSGTTYVTSAVQRKSPTKSVSGRTTKQSSGKTPYQQKVAKIAKKVRARGGPAGAHRITSKAKARGILQKRAVADAVRKGEKQARARKS